MSIEVSLIPIAIAVGLIGRAAGAIAVTGAHYAGESAIAGARYAANGMQLQDGNAAQPIGMFFLETRCKDESLLRAALENYGCRSFVSGEQVDSAIDGKRIVFQRNEQGAFDAVFTGGITVEHAQEFVDNLHDEYTQQVQQQVYRRLLSKAKDRGLELESEEVQQDNSILLTFTV